MAETFTQLNAGTGGDKAAAFADAAGNMHYEVVVQTQNGSSDPQSVNSSNPLPVAQTGALPAGGNVIGGVTQSGTWNMTQSGNWLVQGNVAANGADSGNGVKISGVFQATPPSLTNGQRGDVQLDASGNLCVNIKAGTNAGGTSSAFAAAFPAQGTALGASDGTNMKALLVDGSGNLKVNIVAGALSSDNDNSAFVAGSTPGLPILGAFNDAASNLTSGNVGIVRVTADRKQYVVPNANAIGGWSPGKVIAAATTNAGFIKASAGSLGYISAQNIAATPVYLKLYNKASAPTVGTDVPVHTFIIPGNTAGAGNNLPVPAGMSFSTGIAYAITGGILDTDTTAIAVANQQVLNYGFA